MNRFFYGNFDFEEQLRGASGRTARVERLLLELASCWLAVADPEDRIWCPGRLSEEFLGSLSRWGLSREVFVGQVSAIPRGMELVPWGWSPEALEFGERHRLVVNAPPLDVVRLANSREYSVMLEREFGVDLGDSEQEFSRLCRKLGEVLACVERRPPNVSWVIKANWSHAARERILGRGPSISDADIRWVKQRLARDGVVSWELWLHREAEIGIQWDIHPGQEPELIAITELLVDARGQYAGTRSLEPSVVFRSAKERSDPPRISTLAEWMMDTVEATLPVVNDLARRGYFGPVGIDAMRYIHPDWHIPRTRPLQDINARWTMGRLAVEWFHRFPERSRMAWMHSNAARETTSERVSTSPAMIDDLSVTHQTWLQDEA